ncbi:MAG: DUF2255 family protein [Candidatus Gracilibacteria bacterium]|nr:DUF2255 family protein [Candidatus Gracilibacteria bacterium]
MNINEIIKLVNASNIHQIRSGTTHKFIDITIVEMDSRFFVRPYKFAKNGWYDAFMENPKGEMKFGDIIVPIDGIIPDNLDELNPKINKAFSKKLPVIYKTMRLGFDTKKHEALTLELIPKI